MSTSVTCYFCYNLQLWCECQDNKLFWLYGKVKCTDHPHISGWIFFFFFCQSENASLSVKWSWFSFLGLVIIILSAKISNTSLRKIYSNLNTFHVEADPKYVFLWFYLLIFAAFHILTYPHFYVLFRSFMDNLIFFLFSLFFFFKFNDDIKTICDVGFSQLYDWDHVCLKTQDTWHFSGHLYTNDTSRFSVKLVSLHRFLKTRPVKLHLSASIIFWWKTRGVIHVAVWCTRQNF